MMMSLVIGLKKMIKFSQIAATYMYGMQTNDQDHCSQEQLVVPGSTTLM